jgi:methionyl-tRNA synthetase
MGRFYFTTPIYYVNDVPHLGNAYSTIVVDALARYHRLRGDPTRMLTGTDEHGLKIEREALARGMSPDRFVRDMSDRFEAAWPKLEIHTDDFIRTTQPRHEIQVQHLWEEIRRNNPEDIYLGEYEGWYCVGCEELKTEKELDQPGNLCPLHKTPVERLREPCYFFKLSRYGARLLQYYETHPAFIQPDTRRNEVVSFVQGGLKDLAVSRTSFTWGIPVPGDPEHVMYVWFDALANYWTALQDSAEHKPFWSADSSIVHVVGKDILRFHAVNWPAFLMSAGLPLPTTVFAHGFLTYEGQKMSKSLRNAVDPLGIARAFGRATHGSDDAGADALRYQLLRGVAFGQDGDFDLSAMIERYNADLGKNLGNLLARTLGLCAKWTGGRVPSSTPTTLERDLFAEVRRATDRVREAWDAIAPHRALEATMALSSVANQYVDRAAPWAEAKKGDTGRLDTILSALLEVLGSLSVMIWPVLPAKSDEMRAQLGLPPVRPQVGDDGWPHGADPRVAGDALNPGSPLFPTIDAAGAQALLEELTPRVEPTSATAATSAVGATATATAAATTTVSAIAAATAVGIARPTSNIAAPAAPTSVTFDQFSTIDLRVGLVTSCERVPRKDKILKLAVDLGEPELRTIVSGLALSYQPEQLVGRKVIVVSNLAPRDFGKGLVSHGMVLATGPSDKLVLATVEGDARPGSRLT